VEIARRILELARVAIAAALVATAHAVPLSVLIEQESAKLRSRVEAFDKECGGGKAFADEKCVNKASKLSADLAKHVALVNQELGFLLAPSADADEEFMQGVTARIAMMQFENRWTLHSIKCLGRTDAECTDEAKAIDTDPLAKQAAALRADADEEASHWHSEEIKPGQRIGVINAQGQKLLNEWAKRVTEADKQGKPRPPQPNMDAYTEFHELRPNEISELRDADPQPTQTASPIASASRVGPEMPEKTAPESPNQEIQTFIQGFVRDMASNDATLQARYYNNPCRYYDQASTSLAAIRKDIERDIQAWKKRAYSFHTQPVIRQTEESEYTATFEMAYTAEDPKPRSSGILAMSLRLKQDKGTFLITDIQKAVMSARKR